MKAVASPPAMATARRDLETLFDRMFRGTLFPEFPATRPMMAWEPVLDVSETEKAYIVRLEVPGFHRENLDVKFEAGVLTLTGHRELQSENKGEEYLWREREEGRFLRTLRMPVPVEEGKVEAHYEAGVLAVHLPKLTPGPQTKIAIK